jgi:hypothetical protein
MVATTHFEYLKKTKIIGKKVDALPQKMKYVKLTPYQL